MGGNSILLFVKKIKFADTDFSTKLLNVQVSGDGKVVSYPMGINCGSDCEENYDKTASVDLYAVPKDKMTAFNGWYGDCEGETNHLPLDIDEDKICIADFTTQVTLSIIVEVEGFLVKANGRDCSNGSCNFAKDIVVTLTTAILNDDTAILINDCGNMSSIIMDRNKICTISKFIPEVFESTSVPKPQSHTLTVSISKKEKIMGTVTIDQTTDMEYMECLGNCSIDFNNGEVVTLIANPTEGTLFDKWACDTSGKKEGNKIEFTMNSDIVCAAFFNYLN